MNWTKFGTAVAAIAAVGGVVLQGAIVLNTIVANVNNVQTAVDALKSRFEVDTQITAKQIDPDKGLVIEKPGVYALSESITFTGPTAITIVSDHVTLDFKENILSLAGTCTTGVAVHDCSDVKIKNGLLKSVSDQPTIGIQAHNAQDVDIIDLVVDGCRQAVLYHHVYGGEISRATFKKGAGGLVVNEGGLLQVNRTSAVQNSGAGFTFAHVTGCVIMQNLAQKNSDGFVFGVTVQTLAQENIALANSNFGFTLLSDTLEPPEVLQNVARFNGTDFHQGIEN